MRNSIDYEMRQERAERSSIWKGFLVLLSIIALITFVNIKKEYRYYTTGETVVGHFMAEDRFDVSYEDKDGKVHVKEVSRIYPQTDGEYVTLYYVDGNIETAMPLTKVYIWIIDVCVILALYTLFVYKLYRIYKPKPRF